ncbi:MAG: MotA/TolQ/ExbB proton channel family protein [Gammaproteobacteria bacterium]
MNFAMNEYAVNAYAVNTIVTTMPSLMPIAINVAELKQGVPDQSLIGQRLNTLLKLRASRSKINTQVLQQMSYAKEASYLGCRLPSFTVGLSIMLGMLGTFVGLYQMVGEVQSLLPRDISIAVMNWEVFQGQINDMHNALMGMQSAFITTLVGLVSGVVVSLLNFFLKKSQASTFEMLDRFTSEDLLPATVPVVEDETILEQISRDVQTSFTRMNRVIAQNNESLTQLNAVQISFDRILENIQRKTRLDAMHNFEHVVSELIQVNQLISSMTSTMTHALPKALETLQRQNQTIVQDVGRLVSDTQKDLQRYVQHRPLLMMNVRISRTGWVALGGLTALLLGLFLYYYTGVHVS